MDFTGNEKQYGSLRVRVEDDICYIQLYRPEANNTIDHFVITEYNRVIDSCVSGNIKIVVLEGLPDVFCFGADFTSIGGNNKGMVANQELDPGPLYDLWLKLASSSCLTIAHVRGKTNAGGIGFVAACDIVLSETKANYSLSELLFGLMPACVFPFLIRRVGFSKANYMCLTTQPITSQQALKWGLIDAVEENSEDLLRKHLLRLRRLSKTAIGRYKSYIHRLDQSLVDAKPKALAANIEVFSDQENLEKITRYVKTGKFPWEID